MEILTAKINDLQIIRDITQTAINEIYPRYYPAGAVQFFLEHHSDEHIMADISCGKVFVLFVGGEPVGTGFREITSTVYLYYRSISIKDTVRLSLILQRRRYWNLMNVFRSTLHFRQNRYIRSVDIKKQSITSSKRIMVIVSAMML